MTPRLEVDSLFRAAAKSLRRPGLQDDLAVEPLSAILDSIEHDLNFNHQGRVFYALRLVNNLRARALLSEREAADDLPETESTACPLFVTGFARTGTTLSHRILSLAPDARYPTWCELMEPVLDPRLEKDVARRRRLRRYRIHARLIEGLLPGIRSVHELIADGPEECTHLHEHALDSESMQLLGPCDRYLEWIDQRSPDRRLERYRMHDRCLRSILADRPLEQQSGRWVLKAPQHLRQLDELFQTYPGARVVRLHRDPVATIASTASLVERASAIASRRADLNFGEELLEIFTDWQRKGDEGMASHRESVLEVNYDELVSDPVQFVERIHAFAGFAVTDEHLQNVRTHLEHRPKHRWGVHKYSVERYGITEEEIRGALNPYMNRISQLCS